MLKKNERRGDEMYLKQVQELKKIASNLKKQGKSEEEIRKAINIYLQELKRKTNPNGDLDII